MSSLEQRVESIEAVLAGYAAARSAVGIVNTESVRNVSWFQLNAYSLLLVLLSLNFVVMSAFLVWCARTRSVEYESVSRFADSDVEREQLK